MQLQSEIFVEIALKMNESQLRKFIIDIVRWSETKTDTEENLPFNLRKIPVAKVFTLLSERLQSLFNPFFGYIFEAFLKDFQSITNSIL